MIIFLALTGIVLMVVFFAVGWMAATVTLWRVESMAASQAFDRWAAQEDRTPKKKKRG